MKKRIRFSLWFLMLFMVLQPIFDAATFWTVNRMGLPNVVIFIRIALVFVIGLIAMIRIGWNRFAIATLVVYAVYIAANYIYNRQEGGDISIFADSCKLFLMPITILLIIWCGKTDGEAVVKSVWRGTAYACIAIYVIVLLSLITGTHYPTYDRPWLAIGLNGWFYSGNGQSIILVSATLFLLSMLLVRPNFLLPLALAVTWILLFFNGTRFAYYGLIIIMAGLLVVCASYQFIFKTQRFKWWVFASLALTLALAVGLYPISYVKKIADFKTYQVKLFVDLAAKPTPTPVPMAPSATPRTADSIAKDKTQGDFYKMISDSPMRLQLDTRYKQMEFIKMTMKNAPAFRWLFGYGMKWFMLNVGDMETDYYALFGGYGILGILLFFAPIVWALVASFMSIWKKRKQNSLSFSIVILVMAIVVLFGAAQLAGRALQQPSVSIYFSISIALLYLISVNGLFSQLPEPLVLPRKTLEP